MGRFLLGGMLVTTLTLVVCGSGGTAKKNAATEPVNKKAHAEVTANTANTCRPVPPPGDSEANEAEDQFVHGKEGGSFKVRSDYCDQSWSELNLFYKPGLP
jgi:hypothetical protein